MSVGGNNDAGHRQLVLTGFISGKPNDRRAGLTVERLQLRFGRAKVIFAIRREQWRGRE